MEQTKRQLFLQIRRNKSTWSNDWWVDC